MGNFKPTIKVGATVFASPIMLKQKQIDNLSKYCYDISKLVMGLAVIGNFISDKISLTALWIGLVVAMVFLIFGHLLDRLEVNKNDKH